MPSINNVTLKDGASKIQVWNIDKRVGGSKDKSFSIETKLVQFLLAWFGAKKSGPGVLRFSDVDGVWSPTSQAALDRFEDTEGDIVWNDDVVDPMRPGQAFGSVHHRLYKMMVLQNVYIRQKFSTDPHDFTPTDLENNLMRMPEDNKDVMPADLSFFMKAARGSFLPPP